MLINYIKITFKVLARHKFFSFISLFGISFTLLILMIVAAFWNNSMGNHGVEKDFDRTFVINRLHFYDREEGHDSQGSPSAYFIEKYVRQLQTPERIGISSKTSTYSIYVKDQGQKLAGKMTDANFWKILDFNFLAGRNYTEEEVKQNQKLAVISEKTAREFFGTTDCVGQKFKYGRDYYEILGIVENVSSGRQFSYAEVYLPITPKLELTSEYENLMGSAVALVQMADASQLEEGMQEYDQLIENFQIPPSYSKFKEVWSDGRRAYEAMLLHFAKLGEKKSRLTYFYISVGVLMFLFMLLPAINLVNINISRMMERSSEIGVRKAFGASSTVLVQQFLVENLLITLLGGLIGLLLCLPVMQGLNASAYFPGLQLNVNFTLFGQALLLVLIFGLISGVYPAYRMSKLEITKALNTDQK